MTHHSSTEIDPTESSAGEVPLSDRPLVASDQNTVISSGVDSGVEADPNVPLTATAQEIRDRLFAPPDSEQCAQRGLRIGHFEIEERIGSGGMGAVFRAVDLELSRYVALKVLHPSIAADPSLVARFRNEARACAQLNHDNLARVFFSGEHDGVHYIAYEYADGLTIRELIAQRGMLSAEETVNYTIQATLALSHVDAAGIVHRDIKPSNIILTNQGRVKVVDLGLARRDAADSIGDLTVAGTTLGTFDYIAPEQARDPRTADIRSDIYSLGCTVYHMLTGQPPYPEGTALQKLLDHQGKAPPDPRTLTSDVPPELSVIVQEMMNTDPDQRYQDPGQLLADLLTLATQLGLKSVPAEGIVWRRMAVTRVRELSGALFLTGAVFALCATALIMHFTPDDRNREEEDLRAALATMFPRDSITSPQERVKPDSSAEEDVDPRVKGSGDTVADDSTEPPDADVIQDNSVRSPFRLVHADKTESDFESLSAAFGAARTGEEILLDFDGPRAAVATSRIRPDPRSVQSITLRAAEGCSPVIDFVGEREASRPDQNQMFDLSHHLSLTIIGVDLRVDVPVDVSEEWTLFNCTGAVQLRLKDCSIEILNPSRRDAVVVRLTDPPTESTVAEDVSLSFENVAVRGTSDIFAIAGRVAGEIVVRQSAFALDGSLIQNLGSPRSPGGDTAADSARLNVILEHTSSVLAEPLISMRDSDGLTGGEQERDLTRINVMADSNLFASLTQGGTLVRSRGNAYLTDMQNLLTWQGSYNLYHQFQYYWDLTSGSLDDDADQLSFADWLIHWENSEMGSESESNEIIDAPWLKPDAFANTARSDLVSVTRDTFELDRSLFFGAESTQFRVDRSGELPGVNIRDLHRFPPVIVDSVPDPEPVGETGSIDESDSDED